MPNSTCRWPECERATHARSLCTKHYQRGKSVRDFESPWTAWEPRPCGWCGKHFQGVQSTAQHCSPECSVKSYGSRKPEAARERASRWLAANLDKHRMKEHRRRAQKVATQADRFTTHDVRMAHGDTCYLCGRKINFRLKYPNPKSPSLDHVIALSRGGTHTLGNVAMTHLDCNVQKNASPAPRLPQPTMFAL